MFAYEEKKAVVQKYTKQKVDYSDTTQAKGARAHRKKYNFNFNYGNFDGQSYFYGGSALLGHSEERMLAAKGCDIVGKDTLEKKQDIAREKNKSIVANMYTELEPCSGNYLGPFNCDSLLNLALTDASTVYYSFDKGTTIVNGPKAHLS